MFQTSLHHRISPRCLAGVLGGSLLCAASLAAADDAALVVRPAVVDQTPAIDASRHAVALDRLNRVSPIPWRAQRRGDSRAVRVLRGGATRPYGPDARAAVSAFLTDHGALFGMTSFTLHESRRTRVGTRVTAQQWHDGLRVVGGVINVLVDDTGSVRHAANGAVLITLEAAAFTPTLTAAMARTHAGLPASAWCERAIAPTNGGRLVWLVGHRDGAAQRPWSVMLDAHDGTVIEVRDVLQAQRNPAPGVAARRARNGGGTALPTSGPPASSPCDRSWMTVGPIGETVVTESGETPDPYEVDIALGTSSFGAAFEDGQVPALYGAGLTLHPCFDYTITLDWTLHSWDAYSGAEGFWDVFFVNVNPVGFAWDLMSGAPIADRACDTALEFPGSPIPGPLWTFGSSSFLDEALCSSSGSFSFTVSEPFEDELLYLSVGLDTALSGDADAERPSWGTITVTITATTKLFDPNPVVTTGDPFLADEDDANGAVPCPGYVPVTLAGLTPPAPGDPFTLDGPWAIALDLPLPPECAGYDALSVAPPTSRDGAFPALRDCDAFEAAMVYHHIHESQTHIQSLGYTDVNARQIGVDPHAFDAYNAFYCPDGFGTGTLYFGDGGGDVDSAEDAEIILHEYAHSIQDHQMPNVWSFGGDQNCFGNETRAWGEGFADAWALLHFHDEKEAESGDPLRFGQWFGPATGLRNAGNDKIYPFDMEELIHTDGEIVSGAIMELFMILRDTLPDAAARATVETLLLDGNFLVPPSPDFGDVAEAIIAGDELATGGAHIDLLTGVFAARGILQPLAVDASVNGDAVPIEIAVLPDDATGHGAAVAPFDRTFAWGADVTLRAPEMHDGVPFSHWELDGLVRDPGELVLECTTRAAQSAEAVYLSTPIDVGAVVLAQHTDAPIEIGAGPVCGDGVQSQHTAFARSYDLSANPETAGAAYRVDRVDVAIELNTGRALDAEVRLYLDTDGGAPVSAASDLTWLATAPLFIPRDADGVVRHATFHPAIEVPVDAHLVVEVSLPEHCHAFVHPGMNEAPATGATYVRTLACGFETFAPIAAIGYPASSLMQSVHGSIAVVGDLDGDGAVGFSDLVALLAAWGACEDPCGADLDGDGAVGFSDLVMLLAAWTA